MVGKEVTFATPKGRRRVDLVVTGSKGPEAREVKTGSSPYTPRQRAIDDELAKNGGVAVGKNAEKAGLAGKKITLPTKVVRLPRAVAHRPNRPCAR